MNEIFIGIIGLRHLHPRSYMPLFRDVPGMRVVAAAEKDPSTLASFADEFGVRGYPDWHELIERERLDLAVLFLPHAECPEAAVACAGRRINLLIEKPMAASAAGLRDVVAAADRSGVILSTPYVWRFHPVSQEIKRHLSIGTLGRVVGCEGRCAAGRPSRYVDAGVDWMLQKALSGGGAMHNLGVHWIDLFRWFLEDEVTEVVARNVCAGGGYDTEDNSFALLTFSRGTALVLDISYSVPESYPHGRDLYLALRGTKGVLSWSPSFGGFHEELFVCTDAGEYSAGGRRIRVDMPEKEGYAGIAALKFLQNLAQSLRTRSFPAISGEDGLHALEVVEAIYESAASGGAIQVEHTRRLG